MARRLKVDDDTIANVSGRLTAVGTRVDGALATLENGLNGNGQCWGTSDEFARHFVKDYVPGRDEVLEASKNLGQFLTGLGRNIREAGHSFISTEDGNT